MPRNKRVSVIPLVKCFRRSTSSGSTYLRMCAIVLVIPHAPHQSPWNTRTEKESLSFCKRYFPPFFLSHSRVRVSHSSMLAHPGSKAIMIPRIIIQALNNVEDTLLLRLHFRQSVSVFSEGLLKQGLSCCGAGTCTQIKQKRHL